MEPIERDGSEAPVEDLDRGVEPGGDLPDGLLVRGEEQPLLAAEVQEYGPLGDADLRGDVLDPRAPVPSSAKWCMATATI